ncbi:MAG: hypothetical protein C0398_02145 [Coprothermobacter sp.]|nr:hypothetical protein [Coprothermobacter sp.]
MATGPLRKTVALPSAEVSSSSAETASERLLTLLKVFNLLIKLHTDAQKHDTQMRAYATYLRIPLPPDPIDEPEDYFRFVFNATIVFAVTVLDDLLKSLTPVLGKTGNQDLVAKANAIIQGRSPHLAGTRAIQPKSSGPSEHDTSLSRCILISWGNRKRRMRSNNQQTSPFWTNASQYWNSIGRDVQSFTMTPLQIYAAIQ